MNNTLKLTFSRIIEENVNAKAPARARSQSMGGTIRIFIVDDSAVFIGVATRFLSIPPKYEIIGSSTSGIQAIQQISDLKPDLVIVDLVMPGDLSGLETTNRVKKLAIAPHVIITSFQDDAEYRQAAMAIGADGFLAKRDFGSQISSVIDNLFSNFQPTAEGEPVEI